MTKLFTQELERVAQPRKESAMEKTSRAARVILDDDSELRRKKTERLRQARLQYERGNRPTANARGK